MITSIYIKPTRRKCGMSNFKCFDIYDQDMKKIPIEECDVIDIQISNINYACISMEVINGMIHLWSNEKLDFEPIIYTFLVKIGGK